MNQDKRYTYNGMDIEDHIEDIEYEICTSNGGIMVVNLLNKLYEENKKLKEENHHLKEAIESCKRVNKRITTNCENFAEQVEKELIK